MARHTVSLLSMLPYLQNLQRWQIFKSIVLNDFHVIIAQIQSSQFVEVRKWIHRYRSHIVVVKVPENRKKILQDIYGLIYHKYLLLQYHDYKGWSLVTSLYSHDIILVLFSWIIKRGL